MKFCVNPLKSHKKSYRGRLHKITLNDVNKFQGICTLIPGQKLCYHCLQILNESATEHINVTDLEYQPPLRPLLKDINNVFKILNIPEIKDNKLSEIKFQHHIKQNLNENISNDMWQVSDMENLINKITFLVQRTRSKKTKVQLLTLVPQRLSASEISKLFNVSYYLAAKSKRIYKKFGILG